MNIVHWLSKFPLCYFFWKLCVGFEANFMFEFVIHIDMVERVSSLPKYYVCIRRACTACMSVQKQGRSLPIYLYKQLLEHYHGNTVIFY